MARLLKLDVLLGPEAILWLKDQHADTNNLLQLYLDDSPEAGAVIEELVEALWVAIAEDGE
jgi:hypothetical protein